MRIFKTITTLMLLIITSTFTNAQNLEADIDALLNDRYQENQPGATALVYKQGEVVYRKAFGSANLELDVEMQPQYVFEIGSITKQFTAIAILMLEEQGKLKVEDEITKYIPDYPTLDKTITIHNLLNHTSGIKSYTSMQSFMTQARTDMTPTELIDVFKNEPMDFDPGEQFLYNNSGYILLGHIIEVVSGVSYAEYIEKNIFDKVGMTSSYYGSMTKIIKGRAYGYQQRDGAYKNADYLSLTLPYAAGSIMSNVDDLLKWQKALNTNMLIEEKSYEKAINGSTLNNGESISYGYGLVAGSLQGTKSISHGGGIFGYTTQGVYLPEEDVYVVVLTNCDCNSPGDVTNKIAALVIGKPFPNVKDAITLSEDELKKWEGAYEFPNKTYRHITVENGKIYSQREDSDKFEIFPMAKNYYIFEDGTISYKFSMVDGKRQAEFKTDETVIGKQVDRKSPESKKEITLSPDILNQYIGKYELQPGFEISISVKGNQIFAQATGQPEFELFAEKEDKFFLKVIAAKVEFNRNDNDEVESLTLFQGGQQMEGKKIE